MKRILPLALIAIIILSSCKMFKKEHEALNSIDSLLDVKNELAKSDSIKSVELEKIRAELQITKDSLEALYESNYVYGCNTFFMIVGSFQNLNYAEKWAEKIAYQGYSTSVIPGENGFNLVSARGYNNLNRAVEDIDKFRSSVVDNAWIFVKK